MSAPEVGDRVRVIAGQWAGWEGVVTVHDIFCEWFVVKIDTSTLGAPHNWEPRIFRRDEVEKVPTSAYSTPRSDASATGAPVEGHAANVAQIGGKR